MFRLQYKIKPHLYKAKGLWRCSNSISIYLGIGYTPAAAYADWLNVNARYRPWKSIPRPTVSWIRLFNALKKISPRWITRHFITVLCCPISCHTPIMGFGSIWISLSIWLFITIAGIEMKTTFYIVPLVITSQRSIEWCNAIHISGNRSENYFLNELNRARDGCTNVLVLEEGSISRHYSRLTSEAINALQTITAIDYLPIYSQIPELMGVGSDSFAAHARRTWPPAGDGGRVVKRRGIR